MVHRVIVDIWNSGSVDELGELLAPGYIRHSRTEDSDGPALAASILMARAAFSDLHTEVIHQVCDGDLVATQWRSTGTHDGPFFDLPVTGRSVVIDGMTFSRLHDGRIVEEWESWSGTDLFASLGIVNLWES